MEYIYATLLLDATGKKVDAANLKKVLASVGITADDAKIKAVMSSLEGVDIKEVISKSAAVAAAAPSAVAEKEEEPEEKEEQVSEEEAAAGLGALFG